MLAIILDLSIVVQTVGINFATVFHISTVVMKCTGLSDSGRLISFPNCKVKFTLEQPMKKGGGVEV